MQEYREILESQKLDFLKDKVTWLEWMKKEEIECGVPPSITDETISAAKEQLSEHIRSLASKRIQEDTSRNILADQ